MDIENNDIHHINENKLDNRHNNLVALTPSEHAIIENRQKNIYNPKGYWNGKLRPEQSKFMKENSPILNEKTRLKFKGEKNPKYKHLDLKFIEQCKK